MDSLSGLNEVSQIFRYRLRTLLLLVTVSCIAMLWLKIVPRNVYRAQHALKVFANSNPPPEFLIETGDLDAITSREVRGVTVYRVGNIQVDPIRMTYCCSEISGASCRGKFDTIEDGTWAVVDHETFRLLPW